MSWLPNPFKSPQYDAVSDPSHVDGLRDDLSVLSQTIGRQLRGVAAFLAPPPSPPSSPSPLAAPSDSSSSASSSPTLRGIRNDLAEIGGSFKSGLKTFSNLFQGQRDDSNDECLENYDGVAGITEEVLRFATQLSTRPECWTDFPLAVDDDFSMSDIQREHASTIEHLVPSFSDLRFKLCNYMSDGQFWMIYFILLLPWLNEHDTKLLSTPKIVEARDVLLLKMQLKEGKVNSENSMVDLSEESSKVRTLGEDGACQEKEVLSESVSVAHEMGKVEQENTEPWLEEEDTDAGNSVSGMKQLENEDDVSFSDLEDDDNDLSRRLSGLRLNQDNIRVSSPDGSSEWVKLKENCETHGQHRTGKFASQERDSEGEESNGWLTVDFDSDSFGAL